MKKLAILGSRGIPAQYGGFETFAEELSTRLAARGIDVTVFCQKQIENSLLRYKGVKLVYIPAPNYGPLTTILYDLRCLWRARKAFDVVYMLGYGAAPFCYIPRIWGTTVWLNVDGIEWARAKWSFAAKSYFRLMEMISLWSASRIIADAEAIRKHLSARHSRRPRCTVIPYGAPCIDKAPDVSILEEWDIQPSNYYLVVCRMEPENHVLEIIKGYKSSKTPLPLIMVGNLDYGKNAYTRSLLSSASENVRFIGAIYDKAKLVALRYYSTAYIHGHSVGGTNPSLLEALGCGNVVIAHDNPFNREVAGEFSFYFKSIEDLPPLIHRIERMTEEEKRELSRKSKHRILTNYTWEKISSLYQTLLLVDQE